MYECCCNNRFYNSCDLNGKTSSIKRELYFLMCKTNTFTYVFSYYRLLNNCSLGAIKTLKIVKFVSQNSFCILVNDEWTLRWRGVPEMYRFKYVTLFGLSYLYRLLKTTDYFTSFILLCVVLLHKNVLAGASRFLVHRRRWQ